MTLAITLSYGYGYLLKKYSNYCYMIFFLQNFLPMYMTDAHTKLNHHQNFITLCCLNIGTLYMYNKKKTLQIIKLFKLFMSESFALLYSALFCTIFKKHRVTGIILLSEIVQVKYNINVTYVPYYYHNIFFKRHMVVVGTHLKIF